MLTCLFRCFFPLEWKLLNEQFHEAAQIGDLTTVRDILAQSRVRVNVNFRNSESVNETPLHIASQYGHLTIVRVLLDAGADVNSTDEYGDTPLHDACSFDHLTVVDELIQHRADIFAVSHDDEMTPWDRAVESDNTVIVSYLLNHYMKAILKRNGHRSLHWIVEQIDGLIFENQSFRMALGWMKVEHVTAMVEHILGQSRNMTRKKNKDGELPIHVACKRRITPAVSRFLIDQDVATLHMRDASGSLPVHSACGESGYKKIIPLLVAKGGEGTVRTRDGKGMLPLHVLCKTSDPHLLTVKYLIELYPAALSQRTHSRDVPITLAAGKGSLDVIYTVLRGYPQVINNNNM